MNQVHWARFYLNKAGYIGSTSHGIWTLTDKGRHVKLTEAEALTIFKNVHAGFSLDEESEPTSDIESAVEADSVGEPAPSDEDKLRAELAQTLRKLSANGFERFCQLLLRSVGFDDVKVTGGSGDGGIDGVGTLRINPLLTSRVVFQCKRYTSPVGPSAVRELRGSMDEGIDHGILLATSTFSNDAKAEAASSGKRRIQLVDIDDLLDLLQRNNIGIKTRTVTEVDRRFFADFGLEM